MHLMRIDLEKNCLYLTFGPIENKQELKTVLEDLERKLPDFSPGFACITDLREFHKIGSAGEEMILQIQKRLKQAGLAFAVRIERRQALFEHLQFETGSMEAGYPTHLVRTPEEAEEILEKFRCQDSSLSN